MNKEKQKTGDLVFGINPIIELLKAKKRKLITIYITKPEPSGWQKIAELLPKYPITMQYVPRETLHRIAGTTDHQGIVALAQPFVFRKKPFDAQKYRCLILLDGIQDPRNLGAILRSVYCTDFDGVVLSKKDSAPLNATAIKASAGLAEYLEIYQTASSIAAVQELKKLGYHLYMTTFDGKNAINIKYEQPLCLVIGSEGTGISKALYSLGEHITLPQKKSDISYNASVAAGIILFHIAQETKKL